MIICPNCQKQLPDGVAFCDGCGTQFQQQTQTVICPACGNQTSAAYAFCQSCGAQFAQAPQQGEKKGFNLDAIKNLPKKTLAIAGGAVVALIAIILVISVIAGSGMPNYAIYNKGDELYYNDLGNKKSGIEIDDDGANDALLSSDGKTLFFITGDGDLSYRNVNKTGGEITKWVSDIDSYRISENGKKVTYTKDGSLYQKKLGADDYTKIASDVYDFTVTANGGKILYVTKESDVYYVSKVGKDPVKVVGGVDEYGVKYISDDLKTIVYIKEGSLYSVVAGKDANKIASDVTDAYIFDLKTMYYVTKEEVKEGDIVTETKNSLCFNNGKKETVLAEDNFSSLYSANKEAKALVYTTNDKDSDTSYTIAYNVAVGDKTNVLHEYTVTYSENGERNDYEEISGIAFIENGKKLYYLVKTNPANPEPDAKPTTGDLKEVSVGKKLGSVKTVDTDVYSIHTSGTYYTGKPVYTKEYDAEKKSYDLIWNKKLVANDVTTASYSEDADGFILVSDDFLCFYKSKKVTITDDWGDYVVLPNGDVLYTTDVNETTGKGDLKLFTGKKSKAVDTDVTYIQDIEYLEDGYKDGVNLSVSAPGVKTDNSNEVEIDYGNYEY